VRHGHGLSLQSIATQGIASRFTLDATGEHIRAAISDPTAYASGGYLLPGLGGARLNASARTSVAMQQKSDGTYEYAAHNLALRSDVLNAGTWAASNGAAITGANTVTFPAPGAFPTIAQGLTLPACTTGYRVAMQVSATGSDIGKLISLDVSGVVSAARVQITLTGSPTWYERLVPASSVAAFTQARLIKYNDDTADGAVISALLIHMGQAALPYVPTTTAAVYAPAVDWLSAQAAYGLRSEAAATNLLLWSAAFGDAVWLKTNASITPNVESSPDGTLTADKLVENSANTTHLTSQVVTVASGVFTYSVHVKAAERTFAVVSMSDNATGDANALVNLSTGAVSAGPLGVGSWTAISFTSSSTGSGWYRVSVTATRGAGTQTVGQVLLHNGTGTTYLGNGTSGIFVWGAQLETGSRASSPILTLGATATRAADVMDSLNSGWMNAAEGVLVTDWIVSDSVGTKTAWHLTDGGANERMIVQASAAGTTRHLAFIGGSAVVALDIVSAPTGSIVRDAFAYRAGSYAASRNGSAPITSAHASVPAAANVLRLGHDLSNNQLNGHITRIRYVGRRLTNAQLQALTL
jgi:hypothetical protein